LGGVAPKVTFVLLRFYSKIFAALRLGDFALGFAPKYREDTRCDY
jgi:hypothetical protein